MGEPMMGFFDWLRGPQTTAQTDNWIWLTKQAKFAAVQRDVAQALAEPDGPDAIFVVAHFQDCLDEIESLAADAGWDAGRIFITCSDTLEAQAGKSSADESLRILIVVGERHPLPSHDDALREFARSLSCPCRFVQHVSLEDPLLRLFAGEWVKQVLRQLGMKEDDAIESRMVARRIRAAQEKTEKRATGDSPALSAEEWMEKNCPRDVTTDGKGL
jgi:hypothetical protein